MDNRRLYRLIGKGKVKVTVETRGPDVENWDRKTLIVDVTPPAPDVDDSVSDAYGLGRVASTCPEHRDAVRSIFHQAGNFLFGIPTTKVITSSRSADANDPDRSVLKWIAVELERLPCKTRESCQKFKAWRVSLNQAVVESQKSRQYTRQDWFNAFNEIAGAIK